MSVFRHCFICFYPEIHPSSGKLHDKLLEKKQDPLRGRIGHDKQDLKEESFYTIQKTIYGNGIISLAKQV